MLVVKVELHSAITGKVSTLASMIIHNVGGTRHRGDYEGELYRKGQDWRSRFKGGLPFKRGEVKNYPRLTKHVWHLVARMLKDMGYQ